MYIFLAIKNGSQLTTGKGYGPVNHLFNPQRLKKLKYGSNFK